MHNSSFIRKAKASSQKGGALLYILIAIGLLAALTTTFIQPSGQSTRTQNAFKLSTELNSQSRVIRSGIQDCILRFPEGDGADIAQANYIDPYPLNPTSTEFSSAATSDLVSALGCPGTSETSDPSGNDDYEDIFGGSGIFTTFLPPAPTLMENWLYFNGSATRDGMAFNGVFYEIKSDKSDPFIAESMTKIDTLMSACEVDYTIGDGTNGCEDDHQCLRFWIIRRSGGPTGVANATNGPNPCS